MKFITPKSLGKGSRGRQRDSCGEVPPAQRRQASFRHNGDELRRAGSIFFVAMTSATFSAAKLRHPGFAATSPTVILTRDIDRARSGWRAFVVEGDRGAGKLGSNIAGRRLHRRRSYRPTLTAEGRQLERIPSPTSSVTVTRFHYTAMFGDFSRKFGSDASMMG